MKNQARRQAGRRSTVGTSSSNRRRLRRPQLVDGGPPALQLLTKGVEEEEETREWTELPLDALLAVLRRLDFVDILMGAGHVCRPWRRATQEEPELWRHIDMRGHAELADRIDLQPAARAAVRRSAGRCEAFWAQGLGVGRDRLSLFLADGAPRLKSLRLISCDRISTQGLNKAIRKFHMLEELELSLHSDAVTTSTFFNLAETCKAAAEACPLLKCLRLNKYCFHWLSGIFDSEAIEIAKMRGLQSLQLFGNSLSNGGLTTILHGCARLEALDIRHCFSVEMNDELRAKCARLQMLRVPDDSVDDYDLSFGSPEMKPETPEDTNIRTPGDPDNIFSSWYWR